VVTSLNIGLCELYKPQCNSKNGGRQLKVYQWKLKKTWIITTYKWGWKQRKVWQLTRKFLCYDNVAR